MFAIKNTGKKKFVVLEEDDDFIRLNLVNTENACTKYTTQKEAQDVRDEIVENAKKQFENIVPDSSINLVERDSLTDYHNLTVVEIKG